MSAYSALAYLPHPNFDYIASSSMGEVMEFGYRDGARLIIYSSRSAYCFQTTRLPKDKINQVVQILSILFGGETKKPSDVGKGVQFVEFGNGLAHAFIQDVGSDFIVVTVDGFFPLPENDEIGPAWGINMTYLLKGAVSIEDDLDVGPRVVELAEREEAVVRQDFNYIQSKENEEDVDTTSWLAILVSLAPINLKKSAWKIYDVLKKVGLT